jgi:hypothetical protein
MHPAERNYLRKVSPELDPKIFLNTKKGLGAMVQVLRLVTAAFLLMVCLIKAAC